MHIQNHINMFDYFLVGGSYCRTSRNDNRYELYETFSTAGWLPFGSADDMYNYLYTIYGNNTVNYIRNFRFLARCTHDITPNIVFLDLTAVAEEDEDSDDDDDDYDYMLNIVYSIRGNFN